MDGVYKLCDLDIEKYSCVSQDIQTKEVIITEERIQHIRERHPEDYERFCAYIPEIIKNPDYIIGGNGINTAVVLKEIITNGDKFKLILRLRTSNMPSNYKNSIISFWYIGETTWKKTLKNKKVLYKRE